MTFLILLHVILVLLTGYLTVHYFAQGSNLGFLWMICCAIWITLLIGDLQG